MEEVREYAPEYLMIMPCAFGPERSWQEAQDKLTVLPGWEELPAVRDGRAIVFDWPDSQPPRSPVWWMCWRGWRRCCTRSGLRGWRRRGSSSGGRFLNHRDHGGHRGVSEL